MTPGPEQPGGSRPDELGKSVLRGGAWQSTSRVLSQSYTLIVSIVAARSLGPAGMGSFVFIVYVYTTLVALLATGLPVALNRFTGELLGSGHEGTIPRLYRWGRWTAALLAGFGGGLIVSIALLGGEPRAAWLAAAVACSASILQTIPNAILLGARRWRPASVVGLVTGFLGAVAKLALLGSGRGIVALLAVDAVISILNLVGASFFARRALSSVTRELAPPPDLGARLRVYALGSTASAFLTLVVLQRSEILFLQRFSTDVEIALYSIPFSAVEVLSFVPAMLGIAAASAFATLYGARAFERIRIGFGRAVRLTLLVAVPLTAASLVLGPLALRLAYGDEYEGTAPVLLILVSAFPILSLMFISTSLIQGYGRQRVPLLTLLGSAVVKICLSFALIPAFGALGAACANVAAQTLASLILLTYAARLVGGTAWDPAALARVSAVSAAAALVALVPILTLDLVPAFLVAGVAFLVVFGVLATVLRVIPARDAPWLIQNGGARFGGRLEPVLRALAPRQLEAAANR